MAESEVLVLKVRNPVAAGPPRPAVAFDKVSSLLVGRLIATNEQLAEWDLVTVPSSDKG